MTTMNQMLVSTNEPELKRGLKSRHLSMISIAGVIGGALFVGSGKVIASAGPAAILAYLAGGTQEHNQTARLLYDNLAKQTDFVQYRYVIK